MVDADRLTKTPIFLMGFPRSGTTALGQALSKADIIYSPHIEGHSLYFFNEFFQHLSSPEEINPASYLTLPGKKERITELVASSIGAFYAENAPAGTRFWIDKTPDISQVQAAEWLSTAFPDARFIYLYREPLSCVRSNVAAWPDQLNDRHGTVAQRWAECTMTWRNAQGLIPKERQLTINQQTLKNNSDLVIERIAEFLAVEAGLLEDSRKFLKQEKSVNRPTDKVLASKYDQIQLSSDAENIITALTQDAVENIAAAIDI